MCDEVFLEHSPDSTRSAAAAPDLPAAHLSLERKGCSVRGNGGLLVHLRIDGRKAPSGLLWTLVALSVQPRRGGVCQQLLFAGPRFP
jgi:hypothetical protein